MVQEELVDGKKVDNQILDVSSSEGEVWLIMLNSLWWKGKIIKYVNFYLI